MRVADSEILNPKNFLHVPISAKLPRWALAIIDFGPGLALLEKVDSRLMVKRGPLLQLLSAVFQRVSRYGMVWIVNKKDSHESSYASERVFQLFLCELRLIYLLLSSKGTFICDSLLFAH